MDKLLIRSNFWLQGVHKRGGCSTAIWNIYFVCTDASWLPGVWGIPTDHDFMLVMCAGNVTPQYAENLNLLSFTGQPVGRPCWHCDAHSLRLYLQLLCTTTGQETIHALPPRPEPLPLPLPPSCQYSIFSNTQVTLCINVRWSALYLVIVVSNH